MNKKDFQKFYQDNLDKIYRFVFFRVGANKELAEDLTSEIFIKALGHFADYDPTKSRSAWLYAIAHNHLANYYRDNKRVEISIEEIKDERHTEIDIKEKIISAPAVDGFRELLKKDAERELREILNQLPEEKRELVTLKYLLGYSYREIGEIMGMSEVAVKVATHRIMKDLKQNQKPQNKN